MPQPISDLASHRWYGDLSEEPKSLARQDAKMFMWNAHQRPTFIDVAILPFDNTHLDRLVDTATKLTRLEILKITRDPPTHHMKHQIATSL